MSINFAKGVGKMRVAAAFKTKTTNDASSYAPSASCANCASYNVIILDTVSLAVSIFVLILAVVLCLLSAVSLLVLLVLAAVVLIIRLQAKKQTTRSSPLPAKPCPAA